MRRPHPFACVVLGIRGAAVFLLAALLIGASTKLPDPLAADSQGTELPILMYHSVLRDEKGPGSTSSALIRSKRILPISPVTDIPPFFRQSWPASSTAAAGCRKNLSSFPLTTVISTISPMSYRCSSNTI